MSYGSLDNILDINRTKNFNDGQFPKLTNVGFIFTYEVQLNTVHIKCGRVVKDFDWEAKNRFHF